MFGGQWKDPQPAPQAGLLGRFRPQCCSSGQHLGACAAAAAAAAAAALSRFTPPTHHPDASNKALQDVQLTDHDVTEARTGLTSVMSIVARLHTKRGTADLRLLRGPVFSIVLYETHTQSVMDAMMLVSSLAACDTLTSQAV